MEQQVTTISFFKFSSFRAKLWAFGMMQFAHRPMNKVSGLEFYKLMGTGKARFNPFPDWSVYGIVQIWENEAAADHYFNSNKLFFRYQEKAQKNWVLFMRNKIARGKWNGSNPFRSSKEGIPEPSFIAAITRATIKTKLLLSFWKFVPKSQTHLFDNEGLLFTKGIGEVPFKQMATFSLWKDEHALNSFAYQSKGHVKAIGKTRKLDWYKEELFARFQVFKFIGDWELNMPINQNS